MVIARLHSIFLLIQDATDYCIQIGVLDPIEEQV
jgi:hypothetical protein